MQTPLSLEAHQVHPHRGFLPADDPLQQLPSDFAIWDQLGTNIPALLLTGRLRATLDQLVPLDPTTLPEPYLERAMLLLSVMGNAYVWGETVPATELPRGVAEPWVTVAERLGRPPIVTHASMVLSNWRRLDPTRPVGLDNLDTLQLFLGGLDERWFYLTTVAIEAEGGQAMPAIAEAQHAVQTQQPTQLVDDLTSIVTAMQAIYNILLLIPDKCDPHIFYHRVRPFLAGWPEPGIIYAGVSNTPRLLLGGSAAQSSLIQALDAVLDVPHASAKTRPFLMEMRNYMPPPHRAFIEALAAGPSVRDYVTNQQIDYPALADAYNSCVYHLDLIRKKHLEISVRYILKQAPDQDNAVGTGGTSFVPFLSTARQETTVRKVERPDYVFQRSHDKS